MLIPWTGPHRNTSPELWDLFQGTPVVTSPKAEQTLLLGKQLQLTMIQLNPWRWDQPDFTLGMSVTKSSQNCPKLLSFFLWHQVNSSVENAVTAAQCK